MKLVIFIAEKLVPDIPLIGEQEFAADETDEEKEMGQ